MFLVLYRGSYDDVVVKAFGAFDDALAMAQTLGGYYVDWEDSDRPHHESVAKALDVCDLDVGTYCGMSVLTLADGVPVRLTSVVTCY